jgi:formamidopyrimidine-DNA glycosylase
MPELPEVEAVRRALLPVMQGARFARVITRRPDLRFPFPDRFAARLEGQTVSSLERRGKHLIATLSSGDVLLMHLGMSGSFRVEGSRQEQPAEFQYDRSADGRHDHVVFRMTSGAVITFNDPRRFGSMDLIRHDDLPAHATLSGLGPEPLDDAFDAAALARACAGRKTSLKAALSDQRVVAGLGNIYVCEALHRARLSPRRRASTVATATGAPRAAARALVKAIKQVLDAAVRRSVIWQEGDAASSAEVTYFPSRFRVYDREGARCLRAGCHGRIRRIVQGGRSTFYCPVCQR